MPELDKISYKNKTIALLLCIISLHRFYVGRYISGILQFILTFFLLFGFIWVIIDVINILRNKFVDSKGNYIVSRKLKYLVPEKKEPENVKIENLELLDDESIVDASTISNKLLVEHLKSLDFSYDKEKFNSPHFFYTLYLMCIIAYYGDGKISINELKELKIMGALLIKNDCPDKELAVSEVLLEILDSLKESYSSIEDSEERYQLTLYITSLFSYQIRDFIENDNQTSSTIESEIESVFRLISEIFVVDTDELSEHEIKLKTIVARQLAVKNK